MNYWIFGALNIRHALRNGIMGEWAIEIVHPISKGDKALIYVLQESKHNPSGKGKGCFVGDFTVDSEPITIEGPWIWAEHVYEANVSVPGFKLRDFRLWNFALGKDELVQNRVDINLGMLRAGKGVVNIDRETFLRIVDAYSRKVEGSV